MAINIVIPKDITKYEAKLIGPLTTRQAICCIPAAVLGISAYFTVSHFFVTDVALFVAIFAAAPFILLGWWKPYGIPLEKFVKTVFITMVVAPSIRRYKTNNVFYSHFHANDDSRASSKTKAQKRKQNKFISNNAENFSYN